MKIILTTTPQAQGDLERAGLPFLGIGYVSRHLLNDGHDVKIVDAHTHLWDVDKTVEEILKLKPDAVGVTGSTNNRFQAIELIRALKCRKPDLFIFAGGAHFSLTHEDAMDKVNELDAIVRGEGEVTTVELIRALEGRVKIENVLGVTYRKFPISNFQFPNKFQTLKPKSQILNVDGYVVNPTRPLTENIDELMTPAWELFDMELYQRTMDDTNIRSVGVISSRGCPNRCVFCSNAVFGLGRLRLRSPEKFIDEVEYLHKNFGYSGFDFWDDTMTISKEHVRAICDEIKKRKLNIKWYARARVNTVDKELLKYMYDAGCIRISYGVESGSPRILKIIKKNITLKQVRQAVRWSSEVGMLVTVNFMVNLPYERWDDLRMTVDLMKELKQIPRVNPCYGFTIVYPGTEMESWARKESWMPADFSWNSPYESKKYKIAGVDKSLPLLEMQGMEIERVKAYMTRNLGGAGLWKKAWVKLKKVKSWDEFVSLVRAGFKIINN
ncbi:B12-binding domain-containing radical SAM protein [Patescibacteria group bacterium]|nr:B12-binding domain-containing radical SAM protein [Patescibacteria group bacterium]MBU4512526.1 B12-binding domain-containing radical SAM protein [Patescibacteria group bacterium]MCG2693495.1 B12-binding domain-containing radical SAM protein [Candidatus Parcubacteria bacterium]